MSKKASISGFLEWLPEQQLVEDHVIATIRGHFERAGFAPLRCRSIEPLDVLLKKGETDKEIYAVSRRTGEGEVGGSESGDKWGLHFDLTVPFARFVGERMQSLTFPFRRYQIQPAWRGERPQEGRYREFVQADVDVVARGTLPLAADVEVVGLLLDTLADLPIPKVTLLLNNRKVMDGFFGGLGIADSADTLRKVDKLAKIGREKVAGLLRETLDERQTASVLSFVEISAADESFVERIRALGAASPLLDEGIAELLAVFRANAQPGDDRLRVDLRIARGFDYYTGTVCEGMMAGFESVGAVCSGGRYDNLVSQGAGLRETYPGVGVSIGVSRILGLLIGRGLLVASRQTPTCVLVAVNTAEHTTAATGIARALRGRGIAAEVFGQPVKFGKQIEYAQKKGIPYVWFHDAAGDGKHEVRDLARSSQTAVDLATWSPDPELLRPGIVVGKPAV